MDKVEVLPRERGATLWIEHDPVGADTLNAAPACYDRPVGSDTAAGKRLRTIRASRPGAIIWK